MGTVSFMYLMMFGTRNVAVKKTATINGQLQNVIGVEEVSIGKDPILIFVTIGSVLLILFGLFILFIVIDETIANSKRIKSAEENNKELCLQLQQQCEERLDYLKKEHDRVKILLQNNILA